VFADWLIQCKALCDWLIVGVNPASGRRDSLFFQRPSTDIQLAQAAASPLSGFYERPSLDAMALEADDSDLEEEIRTQVAMRRVSVHSILLDTHTIILDCGAIGYIDFNGLLIIRQLFEDYRDAGIRFLVAGCGKFMLAKLKKSGIYDEFGCFVFPSLFDAVMASKLEACS
jgi:anti-anti-sigma regulatory factor